MEVYVILTIKISDELYEKYGRLNSQNPRHAIEKTLAKYAEAGYSNKSIILTGKELAALQQVIGQIDSAESLTAAVVRSASLRVDDIDVQLTESQRKNLESNAKFSGQDRDDFAKNLISRGLQTTLGV